MEVCSSGGVSGILLAVAVIKQNDQLVYQLPTLPKARSLPLLNFLSIGPFWAHRL